MVSRVPKPKRGRVVLRGALIVGLSALASTAFVHLSFQLGDGITYRDSMIAALLVPLIVASVAYAYIARLNLRLHRTAAALDRLAHTDQLTGLPNRRAVLGTVREWLEEERPINAAIADIDHFKRINDRYGHDVGDKALVHFARMLAHAAPAGMEVARLGGEEFLIVSTTLDRPDFAAALEAMRAQLEATPLVTASSAISMTASFGVACTELQSDSCDKLLRRADVALYKAKDSGRNRIVAAA